MKVTGPVWESGKTRAGTRRSPDTCLALLVRHGTAGVLAVTVDGQDQRPWLR